jgi:hypothetical protein
MKKETLVWGGVIVIVFALIAVMFVVKNKNTQQLASNVQVPTQTVDGSTGTTIQKNSNSTASNNTSTTKIKGSPIIATYPPDYSTFELTYQCSGHCRDVKSLIYEFNLVTPKVIKFNHIVFGTQHMSADQNVSITCNTYANTSTIMATRDATNQWSTGACSNVTGTKVRMIVTVTGSGSGTVTPLFDKWQVVDETSNRLVKIIQ